MIAAATLLSEFTTLASAPAAAGRLLPVMVLLPLIAGLALAWTPREREDLVRHIALAVSALLGVLGLIVAGVFNWSDPGTFQLVWSTPWIAPLGVSFGFGLDAVSLWLILLTVFLMPLAILGSYGDDTRGRTKEFYLWLLVLESALIGVFAATDLILFYIFFEMTLVPLFFLIGIYGGKQRDHASKKFFIYTLAGSVFTFAGVIYVAWHVAARTGAWTFHIPDLVAAVTGPAAPMSPSQQAYVLLALMAGFAVKVPLFPVHTWLPLAHTEAPTSGSVILAGVLLKLGTYGLLRFAIPMTPHAVVAYGPTIACLSVVGILYGALICWVQGDIKKLVAYSSVSHMGFCVLGMFALNPAGVGGSVLYMINHGLSTGALFLCVGMLYNRYHTRDMVDLSGMGKRLPVWSTFMVFFCLASVGLPGLNGFVSEFLTIFGAFQNEALRLMRSGPRWV